MDKETIFRLDRLRGALADVQRNVGFMESWKKNLYPGNQDDMFFITIQRKDNSKCVFQGEIPFDKADAMFQEEYTRLVSERDGIEKEIEDL